MKPSSSGDRLRREPAADVGPRAAPIGLPIAMYAVIGAGAGQQKVAEGQQVRVDVLDASPGDEVTLTAKMLVDGDTVLATPDELTA